MVGWQEEDKNSKLVAEFKSGFRQKADEFLTNYLRNTTTDQEILDFYGEGNIIGRKGIPESRSELLDQVTYNRDGNRSSRPYDFDAFKNSYGRMVPKTVYEDIDLPANSPTTGRPWQMQFAKLAFPYEAKFTPAANKFLNDFRVPTGVVDYGFDTGPNILDRNERDIARIKEDPVSYHRTYNPDSRETEQGRMRQERIDEITELENRKPGWTRPSGQPATPNWWKELGYEIPANIKDATLDTFKETILQREKPFGSVSQLTPVPMYGHELRPGGDPNWRANLYEKTGLAGPGYPQELQGDRDVMKNDVQSFVAGQKRLLPIQPYTEFFEGSTPSVVGKEPAPDFTPFQKAVGTRNYLIGRNILQGRGELGQAFRPATGAVVGAASSLLNPEVAKAVEKDRYGDAASAVARDVATGAITEAGIRAAAPVAKKFVPGLVRAAAPVARFAGPVGVGAALFSQGQTGSLLDVLARKAANVAPADPKTDLGRRAGNEFFYMLNQFRQGKTPYTGK